MTIEAEDIIEILYQKEAFLRAKRSSLQFDQSKIPQGVRQEEIAKNNGALNLLVEILTEIKAKMEGDNNPQKLTFTAHIVNGYVTEIEEN